MNLIIQTPEGFTDQEHAFNGNLPVIGHKVMVHGDAPPYRFYLVVQSILWNFEINKVIVIVK